MPFPMCILESLGKVMASAVPKANKDRGLWPPRESVDENAYSKLDPSG